MTRSIGIDLGTTNSCVAVLEAGAPVVIVNAEGARTTPSVVAFGSGGDVLVGAPAKRQSVTNVARTIRSVKRHMGTAWNLDVDGDRLTAQQVSAFILRSLKRDAEAYLGEPVEAAVITVPAYFSEAQRQATKEAGEIAGLRVDRIVNEPTAAALAYGLGSEADQHVVVFDLGGGTFDVSLLEIAEGVVEVRATCGDNRLGGDDWDARLVDWLKDRFRDEHGVDLAEDPLVAQRMTEAAERAKVELSSAAQTTITLPYLTVTDTGPVHFTATITRAQFEALTADLLDRVRGPFQQVFIDAALSIDDIDRVILVGGSTRMPAVAALVTELAGGRTPYRGVNPDEVVAAGACLQAGVLHGEVKDVLLLDVTPLSLGIETKGGLMARLIERNTTIPTKSTELFTTHYDGQESVAVHVYQGERGLVEENHYLGNFELTGLAPQSAGVPQIEVTFDIDADGLVHVTAADRGTGAEQTVVISDATALPAETVAEMVATAERYADRDRQRRAAVEARNAADELVYFSEKLLADHADAVPAPLALETEMAGAAVRGAAGAGDLAALAEAMTRLEAVTARVGEALYDQPDPTPDPNPEPASAGYPVPAAVR